MTGSGRTPTGLQGSAVASLGGEPLVRYEVLAEIGSGGMATVQFGRLHAAHGFVRSVAIKRLHAQFAKDPEFVNMFIDEARLSARLVHANIVATLDVIDAPGELALVMEYVHGESLWNLLRLSNQYAKPVPVRVATALTASVLHGLQSAHEAQNERGEALGIVHRDVSPHNILVGGDGIPRIIDFGIAKAVGRLRSTPSGEIKGKLIYMAPEQLSAGPVDHRADVYGAAAVLWETLTGLSLFDGPNESSIMHDVLLGNIVPPGKHRREVTQVLDEIVMRGLHREPSARFESAQAMALALEHNVGIASQSELAGWLQDLAGGRLSERSRLISQLQEVPSSGSRPRFMARTPAGTPARDDGKLGTASDSTLHGRESSPWHEPRLWLAAVALVMATSFAFWAYAHQREQARQELPGASIVHPLAPESVAAAADSLAAPSSSGTAAAAASDPDVPPLIPQSQAPAPMPEVAPNKRKREPRPPRSTRQPAGAAKGDAPDCRSWFYVDGDGIRRPKPGCL